MKVHWFLCLALALPLSAQVKIAKQKDRISIDIDGKPYSDFFIAGGVYKPYLHPLRAASGVAVSRYFPMAEVDGESKDHKHHRGLWFTHGIVNGLDFWSNEPGMKGPPKGTVVLKKVVEAKGGAKSGTIKAIFDWEDPNKKPILTENRTMIFYSDPTLRIIDFDIELRAIEACKFGDTKEGFFAIRVATELEEAHSGKMVNAEGKEGEKQVWGKRSDWVDYYGTVKGEKVGIAILDHPGNPGHPTYWHSRSYGLFAANIFGERDFFNDKTKDGSKTLEPGQTWRFRYRVIIHPGDVKSADIAGEYAKYAK